MTNAKAKRATGQSDEPDRLPAKKIKTLIAKLKAHLRRLMPASAMVMNVLIYPAGDVKLDLESRRASVKDKKKWTPVADLTPTEFEFLALFLRQPEKALDRRVIMETVWSGQEEQILLGTVDKHIESLRRKLGSRGSNIRTVYGVGYALRDRA